MAICFTLYPFAQSIQQLIAIHIGLGFGLPSPLAYLDVDACSVPAVGASTDLRRVGDFWSGISVSTGLIEDE